MMTQFQRWSRRALGSCLLPLLAACGGDGSVSGVGYSVGGQLTGLTAGKSVVLQNNGRDDLTITANGGFTFSRLVSANGSYAVTVRTQPAGQFCALTRASGTATGNVTNVSLQCQDVSAAIIKPIYLADTYRADRAGLLTQANGRGASSYSYLSGLVVSTSEYINLYVKDLATTYVWEALDLPSSVADLQAQLNAQGARGYAHSGFLTDGNTNSVYYVKDAQGLAPFSYELLPAQNSSAAFLSQANAQGARGFHLVGNFIIGGSTVAIYGKDSSSARYTYALQAPTGDATPESFLVQANGQGQQGYRFVGEYVFSGDAGGQAFKNIYVKDTTQSATFDYKALAVTTGGSALISQANGEGQSGYFYAGSMIFFPNGQTQPGVTRNLYGRPINCIGAVLCRGSKQL